MHQRFAVAFTGPSNSGKTTLILKVATLLGDKYGKRVAIIKNDPKDKARFDVEGKDSYKFFQTGADVIVTSPSRTTYFSHQHQELDKLIGHFGVFDILLVEGLKTLPLPRIAIFRNRLDADYYDACDVIAIDESIDRTLIPEHLVVLDLNNPHQVIDWITQNAKKV